MEIDSDCESHGSSLFCGMESESSENELFCGLDIFSDDSESEESTDHDFEEFIIKPQVGALHNFVLRSHYPALFLDNASFCKHECSVIKT